MALLNKRRLTGLISASAVIATLTVAAAPAATLAATPPEPYVNGFENAEDVGTTDQAMFNVTQVVTGTDGIPSASGDNHAIAAVASGAFTRYGGYSSTFPAGGYTTSVDVYLDMNLSASNDQRFDWSSAINNPAGTHRRDFVFSVGTDLAHPGKFVANVSNNTPGWPANPARFPVTISDSGWYTFEHRFYDSGAGVLAVEMRVIDAADGELATWTLSDPSDIIGSTVGGNRYGWLVTNDFEDLALDNLALVPNCTPTGYVRDNIDLTAAQIGGTVTGELDATGCDIGVYNPTSVTDAEIHGARYYGVVAKGLSNVNVTDSKIHDIGDQPVSVGNPMHGMQRGIGIFYTNASGTISGNEIYQYQKGGIVARDGGKVTIDDNTVTGLGSVDFIAQNGIQVSFGTAARLFDNDVSLNHYSPTKVTATGLLIYKAGGVSGELKAGLSYVKADNDFHGNETDVANFGKGGGFSL